jgi:hypothetical protein
MFQETLNMSIRQTIDALKKQQERFADLLRLIDEGRWWNLDAVGRLDAEKIRVEVVRIANALNHIEQLANDIMQPRPAGVSNSRSHDRSAIVGPHGQSRQPLPEGLGPFSPGSVGLDSNSERDLGGSDERPRHSTADNALGGYGAG